MPPNRPSSAVRPAVLVVEDDFLVTLVISSILADLDYEVIGVVRSAAAADQAAAACRPDLVLMDIGLQGPVDGIEAARALQARHGVPILFITGHYDSTTRDRAQALGPVGYVLKPFLPQHLETALRAARATIRPRT